MTPTLSYKVDENISLLYEGRTFGPFFWLTSGKVYGMARLFGRLYFDWEWNPICRPRCWLFHRKYWEYVTYGGQWTGKNFHHMYQCDECGEGWPEYLKRSLS